MNCSTALGRRMKSGAVPCTPSVRSSSKIAYLIVGGNPRNGVSGSARRAFMLTF
jgi:hypothetical protein